MAKRSSGVAWGNWLVSKTSGMLDARLSRRSFIARTTLLGSAVAATGCAVITQPGTPYQSVAGCSGGLCTDGYTEFCCVINDGLNSCPPGSTPGGWWRADGSIYCGGGPRYYIDCNEICCGPDIGGFCAGCSPCRCAVNCNTRRVHCNYFRYGQCNVQIPIMGPIACRMVLCTPPYPPYTLLACGPSSAVDDSTANHNANCAAYAPPPPPPPPPPAILPASASAITVGGNPIVASRGVDGVPYANSFDGTNWSGWISLGGSATSRVVLAGLGSTWWALTRRADGSVWVETATSGTWSGTWQSLGGAVTSDPAVVVDATGTLWVFVRGPGDALWMRTFNTSGGTDWSSLGGFLTSDPSAAIDASGNIFVTVRGGGNSAYVISRSAGSGSWGPFVGLGGDVTSDPTVVASGNGAAWVFVLGPSNVVYVNSTTGGSWSGWESIGGAGTSDPAAVVDSTGTVWAFVRGPGSYLYVQSATGGTWGGWQALGPTLLDDPAAAAGSSVWVFGVQTDSTMGYDEHPVGASGPWQTGLDLSGGFAPARGATSYS